MKQRVLPGFGLSLGTTLVYLSLLVLLPLSALAFKASTLSVEQFWSIATGERALAAYRVTFGASLLAALINAVFGLIVAWVLVRYPFPGKRFVDSLVDLPFALPTAVAGITLATLYFGGIASSMWTWSGIRCPSMISIPLYWQSFLKISPRSDLIWL